MQRTPTAKRALAAALLAVAFGVQAAAACRIAAVRAAPDTATLAARWIEDHLDPARDRIAITPNLELPLLRDAESLRGAPTSLEGNLDPWLVYQANLPPGMTRPGAWSIRALALHPSDVLETAIRDPLSALHALRADYLALEAFQQRHYDRLLASIRATCERVARFSSVSAVRDGDDATFLETDVMRGRDAWGMLARTALRVDALGPSVEIYRVPR